MKPAALLPVRALLVTVAWLAGVAVAQPVVTPTATFPSPGSQANSPGASLELTVDVYSPGEVSGGPVTVLGPLSPSTTLAYTSFGSTTFPAPGAIQITGALNGTAQAPFILAVSFQIGGTFCGGFAGWPCMTGPLLFSTLSTPFGLYHLDAAPFIILDGIGGSAPPGVLDPNGAFPLAATGVVDTVTNGGVEYNLAVQTVVADPASTSGYTLSACMTVNQWIFYL